MHLGQFHLEASPCGRILAAGDEVHVAAEVAGHRGRMGAALVRKGPKMEGKK